MRMLTEAGLDPFMDQDSRPELPHAANPHGFYEHGALNMSPVEALAGLDGMGRCAKVFARNVIPLLDADIRPACAILLRRPIEEIVASWDAHFPHLARTPDDLVQNLDRASEALLAAGVPTLVVEFHDLIDHPQRECARIAELVPGLDADVMAAIPDPALRHFLR